MNAPKTIAIGETFDAGTVRIHRYTDSFRVTDLTNAGKRGKTCREMSICLGYGENRPKNLDGYALAFVDLSSYDEVIRFVKDVLVDFPNGLALNESEVKGIRVLPTATAKPVVVEGSFVKVEATPLDATVSCLVDQINLPRGYPTSKTAMTAFYKWVQDNQERIQTMRFREIMSEMIARGISFHDYCSMD